MTWAKTGCNYLAVMMIVNDCKIMSLHRQIIIGGANRIFCFLHIRERVVLNTTRLSLGDAVNRR